MTATELRDPATSRQVCAHAGIPYDEKADDAANVG